MEGEGPMSFFLTSFAHGMDYSITPNCWARSQTGAGGLSAAGGCVQSSVWYSCSTRCTCCMWYACSCMICMLPLLILASCDAPTPALRHSSNKCCRSIDKKKSGIASISLHLSFITATHHMLAEREETSPYNVHGAANTSAAFLQDWKGVAHG